MATPCDWNVSCKKFEDSFDVSGDRGTTTVKHFIDNNYTINVAGIEIPIIKTKRTWSVSYNMNTTLPDRNEYRYISSDIFYRIYCGTPTVNSATLTISEDCKIEASTLHYIDQNNKVVLYKQTTDTIKMNLTTPKTCGFKTVNGPFLAHMGLITEATYNGGTNRTEEWILGINGVKKVLSSVTTPLHPFGPKNSGTGYYLGQPITVDKEIREILVFEQPPSQADPQTYEIMALGFYDYGNEAGSESALNAADGGLKDMYYPEWCRSLTPDPIWRQMADRRYRITWFHDDLQSGVYTPPPVTVDPIPIGSYAKHPELEEVYQFLCDGIIHNSPSLLSIKPKGEGVYLFYPIAPL